MATIDLIEQLKAPSIQYHFECFKITKSGKRVLSWEEVIHNLVTTQGKNDMLDKYFAGSSYTAAWYVGLINNSGYSAVNAADTAASHSGWTELTDYDESTRESVSFSAASSGSKAASAATEFTINASVGARGAFLASVSTKSSTSGILYSAAAFAANRALEDNDLIRVTPTYSLT